MDKGDRQVGISGFTIIETMIVLAVTGALFVSIAATLAGRQNEAEFIHAVQDAQAQIQQVINQVANGFYPNDSNFKCTSNTNIPPSIVPESGPLVPAQGTNDGCIFLGEVLQFGAQSNPEQFEVLTVAANGLPEGILSQLPNSPTSSQDFAFVKPTVSDIGGNSFSSTIINLEYGLSAVSMNTGGTPIGAVAILTEIGDLSSNPTGNGYSNGAQAVDLVPILGTKINSTNSQAITAIDDNLIIPAAPPPPGGYIVNPSAGVSICLASASTNQSGLITIGGSGGQLLVNLSIRSNLTCT